MPVLITPFLWSCSFECLPGSFPESSLIATTHNTDTLTNNMSSFMNAMDTHMGAGLHLGENCSPEYDDTALPPQLALFNAGVRGVERARLAELARRLVRSGPDGVADCGVLVMQLRDCRGGKGERAAALALLCEMARHCPKAAGALVPLVLLTQTHDLCDGSNRRLWTGSR